MVRSETSRSSSEEHRSLAGQNRLAALLDLLALALDDALIFVQKAPDFEILPLGDAAECFRCPRLCSAPYFTSRSSSREMKNSELPGSPCRPARPRS